MKSSKVARPARDLDATLPSEVVRVESNHQKWVTTGHTAGLEALRLNARRRESGAGMSSSGEFEKVAARAREAATRAAAARDKAKSHVQKDVSAAREAAQEQTEKLRKGADESQGRISDWWADAQGSWNERVVAVREEIETRRAAHDVDKAQKRAKRAEDDALFAIDVAYWAVVEAEYAALDAALARMEADEASAEAPEAARPRS
jgi:hypothetical protein